MDANLISALNESLQIDLPENISFEILQEQLSKHINQLIQSDFQKLVSVLYRIDVSETKLKSLLKENPDNDAGKIITELIIERQVQKLKSRQEHRRDSNISDKESW
jgi:hypothetical protein